MIPETIRLPNLLVLLEKQLGPNWHLLDPVTIVSILEPQDYLVVEKIHVLTYIKKEGLNKALEDATFVLLMTSAANNEYADFETIKIPTSLEIGWCIEEAKLIGTMLGQEFVPSESLSQVVAFILKEDGYSQAIPPLEFANLGLHPGQSETDTALKIKGMNAYIDYMKAGHGTAS